MNRKPHVIVKVRKPIAPSQGSELVIDGNRVTAKNTTYEFDHCLDADSSVYNLIGEDLVDWILKGHNGCVFAYGQSGSGKSYTMLGSDAEPGLIQKLVCKLLAAKDASATLSIGCFEVYRDTLIDLTAPNNQIKLRACKDQVFVQNLSKTFALSRRTGSTCLNERSSRSHLVLEISVEHPPLISKLSLVDLAGSERYKNSQCAPELFEDAKQINLSLTVLGNIISNLQAESPPYLRFRDHKLTHVLQPCLTANSLITFICCINPENLHETINTLQFAAKAKHMVAPRKPVDTLSEVERLREEISSLQEIIAEYRREEGAAKDILLPEPSTPKPVLCHRIKGNKEVADVDNWDHPLLSVSSSGHVDKSGLLSTVFQASPGLPPDTDGSLLEYSDSAAPAGPTLRRTPSPKEESTRCTVNKENLWDRDLVDISDYEAYVDILQNIMSMTAELGQDALRSAEALVDQELPLLERSII